MISYKSFLLQMGCIAIEANYWRRLKSLQLHCIILSMFLATNHQARHTHTLTHNGLNTHMCTCTHRRQFNLGQNIIRGVWKLKKVTVKWVTFLCAASFLSLLALHEGCGIKMGKITEHFLFHPLSSDFTVWLICFWQTPILLFSSLYKLCQKIPKCH